MTATIYYHIKKEHTDDSISAFSNSIQLLKFRYTSTFTELQKQHEQLYQKSGIILDATTHGIIISHEFSMIKKLNITKGGWWNILLLL